MSANTAPATPAATPASPAHPHRTWLDHFVEEGFEIASGAAIWKGVEQLYHLIHHPAVEAPAKKMGELGAKRLDRNFKNRRPMAWRAIQIELRKMGTEKVSGRNRADVLLDYMRGSNLPEYKRWAAIADIIDYSCAINDESTGFQLLRRLTEARNQQEFNQMLDDLDNDSVEQFAKKWLGVVNGKVAQGNKIVRELLFLFIGGILVNIVGALVIFRLREGLTLIPIVLGFLALVAIGFGLYHRLPAGFFGGLPGKTIFSNTFIGVGVAMLIILFMPTVTPMEFVSWSVFAVTGLMLFVILLGQPIYAFLFRALTGTPYIGRPINAIFEGVGAAAIGCMIFYIAFPFGHFDEHPRMLLYVALATGLFLWAAFFKNGLLQVLAGLVIIILLVRGFVQSDPSTSRIPDLFHTNKRHTTTVVNTAPVFTPAVHVEKHARKSGRHHKRSQESDVVRASNAATEHDYPTTAPAPVQPVYAAQRAVQASLPEPARSSGTVAELSQPVRSGQFHGYVVMDEFGSVKSRAYPATLYLKLDNGDIVSIKVDANGLIGWHGKNYQAWTLEGGEELLVNVRRGYLEHAAALSVPYPTKE